MYRTLFLTAANSATRRYRYRLRALLMVAIALVSSLTLTTMAAPSASADPTVHTLVNVDARWAPYTSATPYGGYIPANTYFPIRCYVVGETVSGPYGSENVWDLTSGNGYGGVGIGVFVPDALVYTGSNSPVVPRCSTVLARAIGSDFVQVYTQPSTWWPSPYYSLNIGDRVEITCYTTGDWVSGPYGSENIWDRVTDSTTGPLYVPDALLYTGSNSAVVPHC